MGDADIGRSWLLLLGTDMVWTCFLRVSSAGCVPSPLCTHMNSPQHLPLGSSQRNAGTLGRGRLRIIFLTSYSVHSILLRGFTAPLASPEYETPVVSPRAPVVLHLSHQCYVTEIKNTSVVWEKKTKPQTNPTNEQMPYECLKNFYMEDGK